MEAAIIAGVVVVIAIAAALVAWRKALKEDTVFEYQKGLLFHRGRFARLLDAGTHQLSRKHDHLVKMDMRPALYTVPGQEILTRDKISIKITAGGSYAISDPRTVFSSSTSYAAAFYAEAQQVLREVVQGFDLESLLGDRSEINTAMHQALEAKAATMGLDVKAFAIRDIMLPAGLKKALGGLLEAQKEAQIAVEKARGEQAVLRSLANSSRLYAEHPTLLSARLVQTLDTGAHTLVFNTAAEAPPPLPTRRPKP